METVSKNTFHQSLTMENNSRIKFDKEFIGLGLYQFLGGIAGLIFLFCSIYQTGFSIIPEFFKPLILFFFILYSIICGILCLKIHELALTLSYINQLMQLVAIGVGGYFYRYVSGLYLSLHFDFKHGPDFYFGFGLSNMALRFNTNSYSYMIEINLVAIAVMICIDKLRNRIRAE